LGTPGGAIAASSIDGSHVIGFASLPEELIDRHAKTISKPAQGRDLRVDDT